MKINCSANCGFSLWEMADTAQISRDLHALVNEVDVVHNALLFPYWTSKLFPNSMEIQK